MKRIIREIKKSGSGNPGALQEEKEGHVQKDTAEQNTGNREVRRIASKWKNIQVSG
jgi:hypothetical protein